MICFVWYLNKELSIYLFIPQGPITAATLGTAVRDRSLQHMGLLHEMLGLFLSLVLGFIFGLTICAVDDRYGVGEWPTEEMTSRYNLLSIRSII